MQLPSFTGESYVSQSPLAALARTVNFIPERIEADTPKKSRVVLYPSPGLAAYAVGDDGPGRGIFGQKNRAFSALGSHIYEVQTSGGMNGTLKLLGSIVLDGNPVTFDTNGDAGGQLAAASAGQVYIVDLTTGAFSNPTNGVTMVVHLDGRFVGLDIATSTLRISNRLNGLIWDPLQQTVRSSGSDPWRSIGVTSSKELFVLGEKTGDIYYDSGASPFPFVPRQGILIKPGIAAPWSLKEVNGAMIWLSNSDGGSGHVVRAVGYNPVPISNSAVELAISGYKKTSRIDDAVAYTYEQDNHYFYALNFPSAEATWVWDETTGWWHERGTYNGTTGLYKAWGPQHHTSMFGHHLVTDHRSGIIYRMANDEYHDAGNAPLRRLRIAAGPFAERKRIYLDRFLLYLEPGIGLSSGQGANPQVFLSLSRNAGKTYGSERWRSAGAIGQFSAKLEWFNCGSANDWAIAVAMSDPVPWRIVDAFFDARVGSR